MSNYNWDSLSPQQLGECGESYVKMQFMLNGFDIYCPAVDNRGIDLLVRKDVGPHLDVQVKSVRKLNYIFLQKSKFELKSTLLAAIVLFFTGTPPQLYLVPSQAWLSPDRLLVSKDYDGKKSPPEWGLNLSQTNLPLLSRFDFDEVAQGL